MATLPCRNKQVEDETAKFPPAFGTSSKKEMKLGRKGEVCLFVQIVCGDSAIVVIKDMLLIANK